MKSLRCILGNHNLVERHRHHVKDVPWYKKRGGTVIEGSNYKKIHEIVICECSRENCSDQIAYRTVTITGNDKEGRVESKVSIPVDLAKEEMFADKL